MIEFDKWYDSIEKEYPKYQDKDGYNIGNTNALKVGWRAALRWVLTDLYREQYGMGMDNLAQQVKEELEEK